MENTILSELQELKRQAALSEKQVLSELQELKKLTALEARSALTMDDASLLTGLSKSYLYKQTCQRKIPHYKSGGGKLVYFDKVELNAWMLQHKVKPVDEVSQEATAYCMANKKGGKPL
jgi:excisionase family DNA binding protein